MMLHRRTVLSWLGATSLSWAVPPLGTKAAANEADAGLMLTGVPAATWRKEPGTRIVPGHPFARRLVAHPSNIVQLPNGRLRLYYYGADDKRGYVLSATSEDWGLTWRTDPGCRLASRVGEAWVSDPFVLPLKGGGFRLYYKAYRPGWRGCLFSAWSPDGLAWRREGIRLMPGPPGSLDSARTCFPWLMPRDEGGFRLYYGGSNEPKPFGTFRILSALSDGGLNWLREPGVRVDLGDRGSVEKGGVLMPAVYRLPDGRLRMYYVAGNGRVGWRAILSATSVNGLDWERDPGVRLAPSTKFDSAGLVKPSLLPLPDGRTRMFYVGLDGTTARILSAVANVAER